MFSIFAREETYASMPGAAASVDFDGFVGGHKLRNFLGSDFQVRSLRKAPILSFREDLGTQTQDKQ
jgi:hypothetical protein